MKTADVLSQSRFIFHFVLGLLAGMVALPLVTYLLPTIYLQWSYHSLGWLDAFNALYKLQLPLIGALLLLTGALLGALSVILAWGRRGLAARGVCWLISVLVLALIYQRLIHVSVLSPHIRPPRTMLVLLAAPTLLWALSLVFFSLVLHERFQGFSTLSASE